MAPLPLPLQTLRLSSPSFLETILADAAPLYATETYANATTLSRCTPLGLALVASIRWPEHPAKGKGRDHAPAQLLLDGSSLSEDDLLRRNVLNTARRFHIPGHAHALKWRRVHGLFQCTSAAGALVAVFEPAILTARARLSIFVPSLPGLPDAGGDAVARILADYLVVTALLLLTHPEDWRGFAPAPAEPEDWRGPAASPPHLCLPLPAAPSYSAPVSPITAVRVAPKEPDYEPPPPYEEIQWTVRVRQPRRARST